MVRQSRGSPSISSCSIFDSIDPLLFKEINSLLKSEFISQLTVHFYKCNSSEEIYKRIIEVEDQKKQAAIRVIESHGSWEKIYNDFHYRSYILRKNNQKALESFGIRKELPLSRIYFLDQIFYGKISFSEKSALLNRFTQEELVDLIYQVEQFSQENFLYSMNYTFHTFNSALENSYQRNNNIGKDFVQNVYDKLWEKTGDIWVDYKESIIRLKIVLGDIFIRLNLENRTKYKKDIDSLRGKKLEKTAINNLINLTVTYPIVLATNYIVGKDGGGTMKITVSWVDWLDNSIEISTTNPLRDYFNRDKDINLQLLDFGFLSYKPNEIEKSMGLATAIKTGFFDIINFDLGHPNQGSFHNLELFFKRYVDQNDESLSYSIDIIEDIKKMQENEWPKLQRLCQDSIRSNRKIIIKHLYQDFILDSSEENPGLGRGDLKHIETIMKLGLSIRNLETEINYTKRTYQVIFSALLGNESEKLVFKNSLANFFLKRLKVLSHMISLKKQFFKDLGGENYKCLLQLEKFQNYQQNYLQRKTIEYLAKVHAGMNILNQIDISADDDSSRIEEKITNYADVIRDSVTKELIYEIKDSKVLELIENQLNFSGGNLIHEALNLILLPHNFRGSFGYPISDMNVTTNSLTDPSRYLLRRGNINKFTFVISPQDQYFRVREELKSMTAKVGQLRHFFGSLGLAGLSKELQDEDIIKLNPNMIVDIENLKHYKENLKNSESKRHIVRYNENRSKFVKDALEKFYGNNQDGQQIFNYSTEYKRSDFFQKVLNHNIQNYIDGPFLLPKEIFSFSVQNQKLLDLSCFLDTPFDRLEPSLGCEKISIDSDNIVNNHVKALDLLYFEKDELAPLMEGSDSTTKLVEETYLNNHNIPQYNPGEILRNFRYYKHRESPELWTWFDTFLARHFTTRSGYDNFNTVTTNFIKGTTLYEFFYKDLIKARYDEQLFELDKEPLKIFRNYYRAPIIRSLILIDNIIDSIVESEYTKDEKDFPQIAIRRKDVSSLYSENLWDWIDFPVERRSDNSLILLKRDNYESSQYIAQQKIVFKEYQCSLIPQKEDVDYTEKIEKFIRRYDKSCESKVEAWMRAKICAIDLRRKSKFNSYSLRCPDPREE